MINRSGIKYCYCFVLLIFYSSINLKSYAATVTISSATNWSAITTGSGGGGLPNNTDDIIVQGGFTLTVNVANAVCKSIRLGTSGSGNGTLAFTNPSQITVSGLVTFGNGAQTGTVTMIANSTLICQGFSLVAFGGWTPSTGTVQFTASNTLPSASILTFSTLTVDAGTTTTLGVTLTSIGTLNVNGTLALGAATNINSLTTINMTGGTISSSGGTITLPAGTLTTNSSSITSTIGATLLLTGLRIIAVNGPNAVPDLEITGAINNAQGITKTLTGVLKLSGTNAYSGVTTISGGTVLFGNIAALGTSSATTVASGAVLDLNGFTLSSARPITITGTGLAASPAGAFTNTGVTASYSGAITIGNPGATITATSSGNLTCNGNIGGAFPLVLDGAGIGEQTGIRSTTGTLTKNGTGSWILSGANTYTGATSITAGTLKFGSTTALGTSNATTVSSGAVLDLNGFTLTTARPLTLNGTGLVASPAGALTNNGGNASYSGAITLASASTITVTNNGTLTCSGAIGGAFTLTLDGSLNSSGTLSGVRSSTGALTKNGAGTWTLSNTNTYSGVTTINNGILSVATIGNGGAAGNLGQATNAATNLVLSGGTLQYTGATASTDRAFTLFAATNSTINVTNGANTLTMSGNSANTNGSLIKGGGGTLNLSGDNSYTGTTTLNLGTLIQTGTNSTTAINIDDGELRLGADDRFTNTNAPLTLNGGIFRANNTTNGFSQTFGILTVTAPSVIALGTGTHTLAFANSGAAIWTNNLTVTGWLRTPGTSSGIEGVVKIGNNQNLMPDQLSKILINNGLLNYSATQLVSGEIVAPTQPVVFYAIVATGNWNANTTWSFRCGGTAVPVGIFPSATDDVVVGCNATVVVVTVNGVFSVNNVTIGMTGVSNNTATLNITAATNVLTINGALVMNPSNYNRTYTLAAGPGIININGTFPTWGSGTTLNTIISTSTGRVDITPPINILGATTMQTIGLTGAGTVNFYSDVYDERNRIQTVGASNINFYGNYTINHTVPTTVTTWNVTSNARFYGVNKTITASSPLTTGHLFIMTGASITVVNTAPALIFNGNLTLNASSTFTLNRILSVGRSWTNNGTTFNHNGNTITFVGQAGTAVTIGGTASTDFADINIGVNGSAARYLYNVSRSITCTALNLNSNSNAALSSLTNSVAAAVLTVNGDVTIRQNSAANVANSWLINTGSGIVNGNLIFIAANTTLNRNVRVMVTTGSFTLSGVINWDATNTVTNNEIISVTTGTINFNSSISMPRGSGTISVTGANGKINFNGNTYPSLDLNANGISVTPAVFSTTNATCSLTFARGIINQNAALTLIDGSRTTFTGDATVNSIGFPITFGHININNSPASLELLSNISISNNFTNTGGNFIPNNNIVTFSGIATQNITGVQVFYGLTTTNTLASIQFNNDVLVSNIFTMSGNNINLNNFNLELGNGGESTLTRTGGIIYNGILKRYWPTGAIAPTGGNNYGLFPIGTSTVYRPIEVTSISPVTSAGYITAFLYSGILGDEIYTPIDDNGFPIIRVSQQSSTLTKDASLDGGQFDIKVQYSSFANPPGALISDYRLAINTLGIISIVGNHTGNATGTILAPFISRSNLLMDDLNNTFVASTIHYRTPIRTTLYSIGNKDWNDASGTGAWAYSQGGIACSCLPSSTDYVIIDGGHTITIDNTAVADFLHIRNNGVLTGSADFTLIISSALRTSGSGYFNNTNGTWTIDDVLLEGTGTSSKSGGVMSINGDLTINSGTTLTMQSDMSVFGNITVDGTLDLGTTTTTLRGNPSTITGLGYVNATTGILAVSNGDKSILVNTNLTINNIFIDNNIVITNNGEITLVGKLEGSNANSSWVNADNSKLKIAGSLLTTGNTSSKLIATGIDNVIEYNGALDQDIKTPTPASYENLICSNSGIKKMLSTFDVNEEIIIKNNAILTEFAEGNYLTGNANLLMVDNSELVIVRTTNNLVPELTGIYTLNGGTVTIDQQGAPGTTATVRGVNYYNLEFIGDQEFDISSVSTISNDFIVNSGATFKNNTVLSIGNLFHYNTQGNSVLIDDIEVGSFLQSNTGGFDDGGNSIEVKNGNWVRNNGTFTATGDILISGTTSIIGLSLTTLNNVKVTGTLIAHPDQINIKGNYINNGVFIHNNGLVTFDGTSIISGTSTTGFNNVTINGTLTSHSSTTNVTGNFVNNGTFTHNNGTIGFNGTSTISGLTVPTTFKNITISGTLTFPNTQINVAGNWANDGLFNHNNGSVTFNGNSIIIGTSTTSFKDIVVNGTLASHATAINVAGNFANNGTFNHNNGLVTFDGTSLISGTSITSFNNIMISGTLTSHSSTTNVAGNFVNNGTFNHNNGLVIFNGSANQNISGSTTPEIFHNLTVNNDGNKVIFQKNVSLSNTGVLVFDVAAASAYIELNGYDLIIPDWNDNDITGFSPTKFIIVDQVGFIKTTNVATSMTVNFPMGLSTGVSEYALAYITQTDVATVNFNANLCGEVTKNGTCTGPTPNGAVRYTWNFESLSIGATVKLYWHSSKEVLFDRSNCEISHFNGSKWVSLGYSTANPEGSSIYSLTANTTGFSPYAIHDGIARPLPIELISFNAEKEIHDIKLGWVTATEKNNNYFILERSLTGYDFTQIAKIDGAGNSRAQINYSFLDIMPPKNILYYRLSQVDYDGRSETFPIISVDNSKGESVFGFNILKNPTSNSDISIEISPELVGSDVLLMLQDMLGKQYFFRNLKAENQTILISDETLQSGIYIITATQNDKLLSKKLIIK